MSFDTSTWTETKHFDEKSWWIRAYKGCNAFLEVFHIDAGGYLPKDLCTLVRVYFFAFLLAAALIGGVILVCGGLNAVVKWVAEDYDYQLSMGRIGMDAVLKLELVSTGLIVSGFIAGCAALLGAVILAIAGENSSNRFLHYYSVGFGWLVVGCLCILGAMTLPLWGPIWFAAKFWPKSPKKQAVKVEKKPRSPMAIEVFGQWLYGLAHGICFPIAVTETSPQET